MLHRLDRLTLDEARTTAAQTLEVVYCLINNLREVMSGEWILLRRELFADHLSLKMDKRRQMASRRL